MKEELKKTHTDLDEKKVERFRKVILLGVAKRGRFKKLHAFSFSEDNDGHVLKAGFDPKTSEKQKQFLAALVRRIFGDVLRIEYYEEDQIW